MFKLKTLANHNSLTMKKFLLALTLFFVSFAEMWAQVPPPPTYQEDGAGTPGAPGTPVDEYTFILFGIALLIGVYFVWNRRRVLN